MPEVEEMQVEPGCWSATSAIQIMYGIWVNQVFIGLGLNFAFSAVAIPKITAEIKSTMAENTWITSVVALTPPIGCIICGYTLDKIGRRLSLLLCVTPFVFGWFITGFANHANVMIIGRLLAGVGVGLCSAPVRTYCTEITLPNMRGVIGVMTSLATSVGITLQAIFGAIFEWRTICYICGIYTVFLQIINFFLPETPYYSLLKGNLEETEQCLRKFRGKEYNIEIELTKLKTFREQNNIHKLTLKEKVQRLFTPPAYKPLGFVFIYNIAGQLSGITIITFWAVEMLKDAQSAIDPYTGNIMFGVTRLTASLVLSLVIYKVRRRPIAICSAVSVAVLCFFLGGYMMRVNKPSIVPQIAFMLYIVAGTFGYYTIPMMTLFELTPLEVRGLMGGIIVSTLNLTIFLANTLFPYARKWFGYPQTIIGFGVNSLACSIFLYFCLPETKGLTLQEIEELYKKKPNVDNINIATNK